MLIQVTGDGQVAISSDSGQRPYDGLTGATLVGVLNSSPAALRGLTIAADVGLFSFAGGGLCGGHSAPVPSRCPFGPTGFEGPGVSFTDVKAGGRTGTVKFGRPLRPGGAAYFALAQAPAATVAVAGSPTVAEQGAAPSPSQRSVGCGSTLTVNCATGVFWGQFTDVSIPGRGAPLALTRTYSSARASQDSRFGFGWVDSYDMSLSVDTAGPITVHEENGASVVFSPDGQGGYAAPPRVLATLVKHSDGGFELVRRAERIRYLFSGSGRLLMESDANGNAIRLDYLGDRLVSVADPAGRTLTFRYVGGHVTEVAGPANRVRTYGYDATGNLTHVTDTRLERTWTFAYDVDHRLVLSRSPLGNIQSNSYDSTNRVVHQVDPTGAQTSWSYQGNGAAPFGGTTTMTDPEGGVTVYEYTSLELTAVTQGAGTPLAATTRYTYGPAALVTSMTDGNGQVTSYRYDEVGNLVGTTDARGSTSTYRYNGLGEVTSTGGPLPSSTIGYEYDGRGNLTAVTDPNRKVTTYSHDDPAHLDDITSVRDPVGHVTTFTYNDHGDVRSSTVSPSPGQHHTTTYQYDDVRNVTATIDPVGNITTMSYNSADQPARITDAAGHMTRFFYDFDGNPQLTVDRNGNGTRYQYDAAGRTTATTRADGSTVRMAYDRNGRQVLHVDAAGHLTRLTYDPLGRVASMTDPLGRTTSLGYDRAGNQTSLTDPSHRVTQYGYDETNNLISVAYSDGTTPSARYTYDEAGRRVSMTDGTGRTTYDYDGANRLTAVTNGGNLTVKYGYDDAGEQTSVGYPAGTVTRTFDGANQLTSIVDWLGHKTTFGYDPAGNLSTRTYPNGITTNYGASIVHTRGKTKLASFAYQRDVAGQVTSASTLLANGQPETTNAYRYDALNQLSTVDARPYRYDISGGLIRLPDGTAQTFDAAGQLSGTTPGGASATPISYGYDPQGNRTAVTTGGTALVLRYDQANRLTEYGTGVRYTYDGDGQRASATVGATSTFAWDQSYEIPLVLSDSSNSYLYGPNGQPIEQISSDGKATYLLTDGQSSVRVLTDDHGDITGTRGYDPYGRLASSSGAASPLGYTGQYTDQVTGYQYLQARYYDPATGQFITRDPVVAMTHAPFSYAGNNPLNVADPSGLFSWDPLAWAKRIWSAVVHTVYRLKSQLGDLVSRAASVGCELLAAGITGGVGAVAALPVCGAIGGMLGGITEYLVGAVESGTFSWSDLGDAALDGAGYGLIGGGSRKVVLTIATKASQLLKGTLKSASSNFRT